MAKGVTIPRGIDRGFGVKSNEKLAKDVFPVSFLIGSELFDLDKATPGDERRLDTTDLVIPEGT